MDRPREPPGVTMFLAIRFQLATILCCLLSIQISHAQKNVEFDVPAIASANQVTPAPFGGDKLIEIMLPISTASNSSYRGNIDEFRFDVSWSGSVYTIFDYGPRTQTVSGIEGLKSVEQNGSRNAKLNFNLGAQPFELGSANIASDIGASNSKRETWQEIPQQEVLVASGTIDRGTGAFFRFHQSRTNTLEGSRDLVLAYRVPADWKNGILKVECRASGNRRIAGFWDEPFEIGRSFIVPVYIEENSSAQKLAIDFAKAEQELRKAWLNFEKELQKANPLQQLINKSNSQLPEQWPHLLIQSGDDRYLSQYEGYLTQEVAVSAGKFVQARNSLRSN